MSICPNHGGYTGDSCKKCAEPRDETQLESFGKTLELAKPPHLDDADKLALTRLENASLKSFHAMQNAQAQFQNFARAMFEKYKVKASEYTLDMEKLEFVTRSL